MTKTIANKWAGSCSGCGNHVAAGAGVATAELVPGEKAKWTVKCQTCHTGAIPTPVSQATPIEARPTFPLTDEQQAVVAAFGLGESLAVQAGAGTGKTSTLVAIAKSTERVGQYVAFNKAIVTDAAAKMPANVACATAHSLAFRQIGHLFAHRLNAPRVKSSALAKLLDVRPFYYTADGEQQVVQPGKLVGLVFGAITGFCNSADTEPSTKYVEYIDGIDQPDKDGKRTYRNNDKVRAHLAPAIAKAWADLSSTEGTLPRFNPDHYLKVWQLGLIASPVIPGAFILFDEAQDASPVMLDVVRQQGRQTVWVGDSQQQIYEWRGAVDALDAVPTERTLYLTNSFRFGPEVAGVANKVLELIDGAVLRLVGRGKPGVLGKAEAHDAILTRTNASAIREVLSALEAGKLPHLVGGGGEMERFAKAAGELQANGETEHPDLACFRSWAEVQAYVEHDPDGSDLSLMVKLIDDYGVDKVIMAVGNTCREDQADVVISTAHRSKGREWDTVKLGADFSEARTDASERRLLYVAVTRARLHLDYSICPAALDVMGELHGDDETEEEV